MNLCILDHHTLRIPTPARVFPSTAHGRNSSLLPRATIRRTSPPSCGPGSILHHYCFLRVYRATLTSSRTRTAWHSTKAESDSASRKDSRGYTAPCSIVDRRLLSAQEFFLPSPSPSRIIPPNQRLR